METEGAGQSAPAEARPSVEHLIMIRGNKRASLTKTLSTADRENLSIDQTEFLIQKLENLGREIGDLDGKIDAIKLASGEWDGDKFLEQTQIEEGYFDRLELAVIVLKNRLKTMQTVELPPALSVPEDDPHRRHKISLPKLELPTFDGSPEKYHRFITSFDSLISKYNLSTFEKYSYLKAQVSGSAKVLLESIALEDLNYQSAVKLLDEAYNDKLEQQYSVIRKLWSLQLAESESDAFRWIGEARVLCDQVKSLSITGEIFTQFLLWNSMSDEFRKQFVSITNKNKPSLRDMNSNWFDANLRLIDGKKTKSSTSFDLLSAAVAIEHSDDLGTNKQNCTLCSVDNSTNAHTHKLSNCSVYTNSHSKVCKLKSVGGCVKCGSTFHSTKDCKFKFSRPCFKCKKGHMSYLCDPVDMNSNKEPQNPNNTGTVDKSLLNKSSSNDNSPDSGLSKSSTPSKVVSKPNKITTNGMVTIPLTIPFNDVILPTGTVYVNENGKKVPWRLFKDMGSQSTFVEGNPGDIPGCTIIDNVNLTVKGINSEKQNEATIVKFPIDVPGQGTLNIQAICTNKIGVNLTVKGLGQVAEKLAEKHCNLADKFLNSEKIGQIKILLGSDNNHVFPITQESFGEEKQSSLLRTPAGIMLSGSASNYLRDLNCLPDGKQL